MESGFPDATLSAAAEAGDVAAAGEYGKQLFSSQRYEDAVPWLYKAAVAGDLDAAGCLGFYYHEISGDRSRGWDWWCHAAKAGHADSAFNLGLIAARGDQLADGRFILPLL